MRFPFSRFLLLLFLGYGFYEALWVAPTDQIQGDVYRIIYYHVPSAWTAFVFLAVNFVASIVYLVRRNLKADAVAVSAAEVGLVFCTVVLVTGPIWARPVWGIWWTWDWRLTSTLVMWLIYISYLVLRRFSSGGQTRGAGRGAGDIWRLRHSPGVLFYLVFSNPASAASHWGRGFD